MAVDMFLELDKIKGETQDSIYKAKGGIDVLAWSWGMSQSGTTHQGGGGGAGKANFQDVSITKYVDKSSPTVMQYLTKGTHIVKGTLTVRKAGDKPLEYIKVEMEDIMVTSVSTGGSGGEDRLTENLSLNFSKFKVIYTEQTKDGSKGSAPEFAHDIAANEAS